MKEFKAESKKLLDMMINSIYTHKEIFLRELISNASDAIDRLYYKALTENLSGLTREDFSIDIRVDKEAGTITVSDNGCGMTEEDLDNNLGTIAHSGALDFKNGSEKKEDIEIIGQFGVGFYSAFMVSERVTVLTKAYGSDKAYLWSSTGVDGYTVEEAEKESNGSVITLYLKEEDKSEFADEYRLRHIIKQYSDYIRYPITLNVEKTREIDGKDGKKETETYTEIETVNSMVPIWKKKKSEVKPEEYDAFYSEKYHDYDKPLHVIQTSTEGAVTYSALLFLPSHAPYDYYTKNYEKGLQLYSNGVVIMEKCADLLPDCFSFVKGLVDSSDFTLNISRETLQHNRQLTLIAQNLEKKIKSELLKLMKDDREKYEKFYTAFGLQLKIGVYADFGMKKDLLKDLLMFRSDKEDKLITFAEYVAAMPADEKYIYYATGATNEAIKALPQTEMARSKGLDILYLTHEVDEFAIKMLHEYEGKEFKSVSAFEAGEETQSEQDKGVLDFIKESLGDKVVKVTLSSKLVKAPVCLTSQGELSIEMEKVLKSMPNSDGSVKAEKVLEINDKHEIYSKIRNYYETDKEKLKKLSLVLYNQARLIEGLPIENPSEYSELLMELL
ncbi:MAG: molecular chaperone HtpG [Christensenellales bacterium]